MGKITNFFDLISLIGANKFYVIFLIFLMLISSLLDLLSLGLISPYISSIFDLETNLSNSFIMKLYFFDKLNEDQIKLFFTIFLILIFFLKTCLSILIILLISLFAF